MTAGTVRLTISTRRTEKGTRTEGTIMNPEACAVGRVENVGVGSNDIHNKCNSNTDDGCIFHVWYPNPDQFLPWLKCHLRVYCCATAKADINS